MKVPPQASAISNGPVLTPVDPNAPPLPVFDALTAIAPKLHCVYDGNTGPGTTQALLVHGPFTKLNSDTLVKAFNVSMGIPKTNAAHVEALTRSAFDEIFGSHRDDPTANQAFATLSRLTELTLVIVPPDASHVQRIILAGISPHTGSIVGLETSALPAAPNK